MDVHAILELVKLGKITIDEAENLLKVLPYEDLEYAKIDHHRKLRTGCAEVIFSQGKTPDQVANIFLKLLEKGGNVLATRADLKQFEATAALVPSALYDPIARTITVNNFSAPTVGCVSICSAGTADMPVAMEAANTATIFGANVNTYFDIGIAGIHRLLYNIDEISKANVIVAVAGMEGALPSVLAGLVNVPVIATPTSVGYGANLGGISALLTMINSCSAGVSTVNIDNGFGAGYLAAQINSMVYNAYQNGQKDVFKN